ncbi:hypothetical protein BDN67DRAFT_974203 [Paxillus ammoniavirescens]|nr:hypothetical protein BDN67DRAFT_974203 [Paxillus ammoniavirescens]
MPATELNPRDAEANTEIMDPPNDALLFVSPATDYRQRMLDTLFLMISLGLPTIKRLNEIIAPENKNEWKDFKSDLSSHVQNVTLVAALILGTTAVFLTTQPTTSIANWIRPMPYLTLIVAIGLAGAGVGCGMFLTLILVDVQPRTLERLSEGHLGITLTLLGLPALCTNAAGIVLLVALTGSVWCGDNAVAKVEVAILTVALIAVFFWCIAWLASMGRREAQAGGTQLK